MRARLLAIASTLLVTAASTATLAAGPARALAAPADPLAAAAVGTQQANESTQQIKQYWTAGGSGVQVRLRLAGGRVIRDGEVLMDHLPRAVFPLEHSGSA